MLRKKFRRLIPLVLLCLWGCRTSVEPLPGDTPQKAESRVQAESAAPGTSGFGEQGPAASSPSEPAASSQADLIPYQAPEFLDAVFEADKAQGENGVLLDLSKTEEGYVGVSAQSQKRLKFQVLKDESTYTYDLSSQGEPAVFPLQCGDGNYTFRVMENITAEKYAVLYTADWQVSLKDEFQPFLRPSEYVDYSRDSKCVKEAQKLAAKQEDALGVVEAVFDYICQHITYDKEKAQAVSGTSGYLPDPDETLSSGKGICFDYASLAAAMLRSEGIPAKVVFGYVQPNDLYHAWNMFYTEESGWVTVEYQVDQNTWNRLDLTFSANGADAEFVGDGKNYANVYFY